MNQHKPILTDAEMHALIYGNPSTLGLSIARLKDFIRQVEKAVVAKLVAEQKPVMYARTYNGEIDWDEHCVAADSGTLFDRGSYHDENDKIPEGYAVMPLYAHPMPCVSTMSDKTACVSENAENESQKYTVRCNDCWWHGGEDDLDHNKQQMDLAKELYGATKDRSSDSTNITKLSLSIDTKETQALLQSYLDSLEGWQLVPVEPIEEMLKKVFPEIFDIDGMSKNDLIKRYQAMLAEAPKYTQETLVNL